MSEYRPLSGISSLMLPCGIEDGACGKASDKQIKSLIVLRHAEARVSAAEIWSELLFRRILTVFKDS